MEIRASAPNAPYVNTGIPKVAETPLEGGEASQQEIFGPFPTDSPTVPKSPNSKGYSVRFEGESQLEVKPDPIEKAIDSIFLFIDDVREAGNTVRGEGCMSINMDVSQTLEHVTEGLCRNPCADPCTESFRQIQPPVDLMLETQSPSSAADELREEAEPVASPSAPQMDYDMISKENSVKDLSASVAAEEKKMKESTGPVPTYTPVETISDKMRTLVPENTLQLVLDSFVIHTGEVKPNAEELTIKTGQDSDPIIEAIDRLILFFDDVQAALMSQKIDQLAKTVTSDLQASLMEKRDSLTNVNQNVDEEADYDKSDNTTVTEDTTKTASPGSLQMTPKDYAEAVASAAEILTQTAPSQDQSSLTKEELHKQALERIMAEIPDFEEGVSDNMTEAQILEELMKDAENAIRVSRSKEQSPKEELVVLGHSGTLTPIPEADEASAGTPASDLIEQAVIKGAVPQVPLLPCIPSGSGEAKDAKEAPVEESPKVPEVQPQKEQSAKQMDPIREKVEEAAAPIESVQESQNTVSPKPDNATLVAAEGAETDLIVAFIDNIFMFFDDMQEQRACEGCLGAPAPEEDTDGDEIVEKEEAKEESENSILHAQISELKKPIDSRGQKMLEEALRLVQEAKAAEDAEEAIVAIRSTDVEDRTQLSVAAMELIEKLGAAFDEAREQTEPRAAKKIFARGIQMDDTEKNRAIASLVEAAFEESDKLRRALNSAVDHPGLKGKGMGTPQLPSDANKVSSERQAKVEFEIPELMKHSQDPYVAWEGDDSELMASINADRKLSEMEHENIFRDVSKGLQESAGGIITRADNSIFSIYKAPAFTEGNSGSAELPEYKFEDPARAAVKVLCGDSQEPSDVKKQPDIVTSRSSDALRARELGPAFPGWGMSSTRQDKLRSKKSM